MTTCTVGLFFLNANTVLQNTYTVSAALATVASIAIQVVSIVYCRRKNAPRFARSLPWYFAVSNLTEVFANAFPSHQAYIYWAFAVVEGAYYVYFFYQLLQSQYKKQLAIGMSGAFLLTLLLCSQHMTALMACAVTIVVEAAVTIIPCLAYFREVFDAPQIGNLEADPGFWIVTGIFFYFLIQIPVVWFTSYYFQLNNRPMSMAIYSINNYALVISYILFSKGLTCLKKTSL